MTQGKKSVVSVTGHLDTTVTDGSFDFDIKFGDMSVHKCTGDICRLSKCFSDGITALWLRIVTMDFDVSASRIVPKEFDQVQWTKRSPCEGRPTSGTIGLLEVVESDFSEGLTGKNAAEKSLSKKRV